MKICYLNHDTRNNTGAGRFYNSFSAAVKKAIPGADIEVLTSENILYPNKLKLFFALPVIRKILKRCDIVHALDGWPYGVIAALATFGLRKEFIITAIGTGAVQPLYSWWRRPIMKWAYRKADKVVAVSNNTKKEILKFLPDLKIEVINHGVDYEKFRNLEIKKSGHIPNSQFPFSDFSGLKTYILSVGALKKRKGYDYSIQAFVEVLKEIKKSEIEKLDNIKYVIVGSGPESENLKFKIKNLKLEDRVIFLDNLSEEKLISLYKNAELFILLPQDIDKDIEGFGLAFLEAAAAGLPVIGVSDSSAADAILDKTTGFLVPAKDYQAAADSMIKILSNSALRNTISVAAAKFAKERSWDKTADQYKRLIYD